jgi:NitT/TauT family transport system substrate-binding protein
VAWSPFESNALFFVAQDQGFFLDNGLDVTPMKYDSGAGSLTGVLAGEADVLVGATEFPLVNRAFQKANVKTIGVISRSEFIYIVARKDRGIEQGSDLKGKRVGTTIGTIAELHLGRYLQLIGLGMQIITLVDLKTPEEWVNAVIRGDVDAVCTAQPYANSAKLGLGANAIAWSAQSNQPQYAQAMASGAFIAAHPDLIEGFIRALAQAEDYVITHPGSAPAAVQKWLSLDESYLSLVQTQNRFVLSLDQSLVTAMEDEARWLISNNRTTEKTVPNFLDFIYEDALKQVKPDSVRIIR